MLECFLKLSPSLGVTKSETEGLRLSSRSLDAFCGSTGENSLVNSFLCSLSTGQLMHHVIELEEIPQRLLSSTPYLLTKGEIKL